MNVSADEVAENGDFADWRIPPNKGGGIGGAMGLTAGAKRVLIARVRHAPPLYGIPVAAAFSPSVTMRGLRRVGARLSRP